jgi:hypothetical protein
VQFLQIAIRAAKVRGFWERKEGYPEKILNLIGSAFSGRPFGA